MKLLPFKHSSIVSMGVELELQIVDPTSFNLASRAKDLLNNIKQSKFSKQIKPEITQSMIELNTSIHLSTADLYNELWELHGFLLEQSKKLQVHFSGGGSHPFQKWTLNKIFPTKRFKTLARRYRYLTKRATIFGQHVHIGCSSGEEALYLTHALARYVPQFIVMSAASPYYQGIDTGYASSRSTVFSSFPLSGVIPYLNNWKEFSEYFYKMRNVGIVESMKDFYWDIRPKPEFGTVEIRVFDTPLSIKKAVLIAAFAQALSLYLLQEKPIDLSHDLYYLYNYNRFQASRYGFDGDFINPFNSQHTLIYDDMLETLNLIMKYAEKLKSADLLLEFKQEIINKQNDAATLREIYKKVNSLPEVVRAACSIWKTE